ncbi:MAG: hypothetical protein HZB70_03480 [Candidatus Berkelbacteria bacterium]|nr:MAG: hypothetical protein HZB70_03480 [Candidatus Berkelbacteria bacterium]QQG51636.1 MAG: hypothetical protein HY845_03710 [Candidatus Berkelbacteria bacterium]
MEQALIKLGLSEKEAKVYLATLELGEDTVQNIAKKSGVNRATTYVILEHLMGLGLVSSIEHDKKTKFIAESPTELGNILEEQKREIDGRRAQLDDLMSQLMAVYNTKKGKPIVRYFEGPEGLETLDKLGQESLKDRTEQLAIIPIDIIEEEFPSRRKTAVEYRVKMGVKTRVIYTHKNGPMPDSVNEKELREAVFLPRHQFPITVSMQIHPDWGVKFYSFKKGSYLGVLVQSPEIANNMKLVFELAWEAAQKRQSNQKV